MENNNQQDIIPKTDGPVRLVLDTDTKNEIDDQFAVVYSLLSPLSIQPEAFHAAPFAHPDGQFRSPEEGMEASYQELNKILSILGVQNDFSVVRGSRKVMTSPDEPIDSEAARNLIHLAKKDDPRPLYVAAIGAVTNVASALLMEPEIASKIVVVWLGAHPMYWDWKYGQEIDTPNHFGVSKEFNTTNDPYAVVSLFDSGVPIVWIPCKNVAEHLRISQVETDTFLRKNGKIGTYLADLMNDYLARQEETFPGESYTKVLWDISTIAYLINPDWVPTIIKQAPKFDSRKIFDLESRNPFVDGEVDRHLCRIAQDVKRDSIYGDFFSKVEMFSRGEITF